MRSGMTSRGFSIAYRVEGTGPPMLLLAGLSQWSDQWFDAGYHHAFREFRLIVVDRLGHGDSDRPTDADAYREDLIVSDAVAVLSHLGVRQAVVWGFSLGAKDAMSLAVLEPSAVSALICGSNADMTAPDDSRSRLLALAALCHNAEGVGRFLAAAGVDDPQVTEDFLAHNPVPDALAACLNGSAELWVDPRDVAAPMLWYIGEAEGGFRDGELQVGPRLGVEMHMLPEANHFQAFQRSEEVAEFVAQFLRRTLHTGCR